MKVVDNGLLKLQMEYHQLLQAAANAAGNVAHLTLRRVVQQLLGHSGVSWGGKPTKMHWLDVLKRCDTKSEVDTRRIIRHGWENPPKGCTNPKSHIKFGDGQTNHRDRDEKKDCPETARGLIVGIGNFHPHAHFMFACITGCWWCVCMIFQIREVQDLCSVKCGSDLTVPDALNHCWYTGNAVPLDQGDYRYRRPWVYRARVAQGASAGAGRASAESAESYVRGAFEHHMFRK